MLMFDATTGAASVFTIFDPMAETWTTLDAQDLKGKTFQPIVPAVVSPDKTL